MCGHVKNQNVFGKRKRFHVNDVNALVTLFTSKDKTRMLEKHLTVVDFQEQGFSETTVVYSDILKKELIQK